jgi:hypothetical protein
VPVDERKVVLHAVDTYATEESTWGHIKSLYR